MQVTLLSDFLGAGKTTFLKRLLHEHPDRRFGVIVNDLSELEVDGELVRFGHAVGEEAGTRSTGNLLADQLQAASVIVVSRIDLVPEVALPLLLRSLQVIQPGAALAACAYRRLDATVLFDAPPNTETAGASWSATTPGEEDGLISAIVIRDVRPLHPQRFYDLDREHLSNKLRDTHSVFGDRARELTLIGLPRDRDRFVASLRDCFCTEAEISRWQAGGDFPDPWPKRLKLLQ